MEVGLTMGGVGFLLPPPDIISSVMSLPPWFGSRIRIYGSKHRKNSNESPPFHVALGVYGVESADRTPSTTPGRDALPGNAAMCFVAITQSTARHPFIQSAHQPHQLGLITCTRLSFTLWSLLLENNFTATWKM